MAHHQEDEQGEGRPHQLLVEGDLGLRLLNLREERHERLDEVEESYYIEGAIVSGSGIVVRCQLMLFAIELGSGKLRVGRRGQSQELAVCAQGSNKTYMNSCWAVCRRKKREKKSKD